MGERRRFLPLTLSLASAISRRPMARLFKIAQVQTELLPPVREKGEGSPEHQGRSIAPGGRYPREHGLGGSPRRLGDEICADCSFCQLESARVQSLTNGDETRTLPPAERASQPIGIDLQNSRLRGNAETEKRDGLLLRSDFFQRAIGMNL
jgi:hypothetical protein